MRLRNVKGSREAIAANEWVVKAPYHGRGSWASSVFGNANPIHIEIGMGKGQFLLALARKNPKINYIGVEKYSSVLVRALEKMEEDPLPNLRFLRMDAERLQDAFAPGEIARIYLNFSDPWPKERHKKRRLTSREFLCRYGQILKGEGKLFFKTDNRQLFDFSLEQAEEAGWKLEGKTEDLHRSEYAADNVTTEYETKFAREGKPIFFMVISR